LQGYNAQAVACTGQIVLAAEITKQTNDYGQLEPMLAATSQSLAAAGVNEPLRVVLADAGYWSSPQIAALKDKDIEAIVPTKAQARSTPRKKAPRQGPRRSESKGYWRPPRARRFTANDNRSSSRSSLTRSSSDGSTGSNAEDYRPVAPNGGSSQQHTTSSSSGAPQDQR
jgi:hypothetical protein